MTTITTRIELAFGANLTANPATWTYFDVSPYGLGSVSVAPGRQDEAVQTQPARCTFRLRNVDGRFTPRFPTSPYYPNVRRQTPVRISLDPGTGYVVRFQGYIDVIEPSWPSGNSEYAEVSITASGSLRRLGQGNSPLRSALHRAILTSAPVVYWPLATGYGSGLSLGSAMAASGTWQFSTDTAVGAEGSVQHSGTDGALTGPLTTSGTTSFRVDFAFKDDSGSATNSLVSVVMAGGGVATFNPTPGGPVGLWHHERIEIFNSGGSAFYDWWIDGVQVGSGLNSSATYGDPIDVILGPGISGVVNQDSFSDVAVWTPRTVATDIFAAFGGYAGETATARLTRLCGEQSVPIAITGTSTTLLGPQKVATFTALLRECETADMGILYDGGSAGLSYLARPARYNQSVAVALDCYLYQVKLPFSPVEDDQQVRNDWTVSRQGGGSARYADAVHIAANGLYDESETLNVQSDGDLLDQASWRVHRDTADEMRLPSLTFDPLHNPELQTQWLATAIGKRLTATNLPIQYPLRSTDQVIEGYTETWDSVTWSVTPNLSPYRPWEVLTIQDARLGRIETDGSTLSGGPYSAGTTSFSVASSGGLWDTGSTPFDIECEGEQITVTNVTGSSSPQTFTVTRSVNGVAKTHAAGAVVKLWKPGVLAL